MSIVIPPYAICCVPHDCVSKLNLFCFSYHTSTTTSTNTTNVIVFLILDVLLYAKKSARNRTTHHSTAQSEYQLAIYPIFLSMKTRFTYAQTHLNGFKYTPRIHFDDVIIKFMKIQHWI